MIFLFFIVLFCIFVPVKFTQQAQASGVDIFHSERYASVVSILNCFAAGIFLGTCLLHLFPDVNENVKQAMEFIDPENTFPFAEFTICMGFFLLLTIEQIISDIRERNLARSSPEALPILRDDIRVQPDIPTQNVNHDLNSSIRAYAMTVALVIHATFEGIAIGVQNTVDSVLQICIALILHKIVISFSLGLTLSQSPIGIFKSATCGLFFATASPVGVGIGLLLTNLEKLNGSLVVGSLQGMAAGTFLYVVFMEVLPHEFRSRSGHTMHLPKLLSFILGFSTICGVIFLFPD